MSIKEKQDQRSCAADGETGMVCRQPLKLSMLPVSCAVQASKFGKVVANSTETSQQTLQHVRSACGFMDTF